MSSSKRINLKQILNEKNDYMLLRKCRYFPERLVGSLTNLTNGFHRGLTKLFLRREGECGEFNSHTYLYSSFKGTVCYCKESYESRRFTFKFRLALSKKYILGWTLQFLCL